MDLSDPKKQFLNDMNEGHSFNDWFNITFFNQYSRGLAFR